MTDDLPERYQRILARLEQAAFDDAIGGVADPAVPSTACAAPRQRHPWYAGMAWIVEWLNREGQYADRDDVMVPVSPSATAWLRDFISDPPVLAPMPSLHITRRQVVAPCPYVGEPVAYLWHVGVDNLGRQVAGDAILVPQPPGTRWAGPFRIG
jgi:hypothetical protein